MGLINVKLTMPCQGVALGKDAGKHSRAADQHSAASLLIHPLKRVADRCVRLQTDRVCGDHLPERLGCSD